MKWNELMPTTYLSILIGLAFPIIAFFISGATRNAEIDFLLQGADQGSAQTVDLRFGDRMSIAGANHGNRMTYEFTAVDQAPRYNVFGQTLVVEPDPEHTLTFQEGAGIGLSLVEDGRDPGGAVLTITAEGGSGSAAGFGLGPDPNTFVVSALPSGPPYIIPTTTELGRRTSSPSDQAERNWISAYHANRNYLVRLCAPNLSCANSLFFAWSDMTFDHDGNSATPAERWWVKVEPIAVGPRGDQGPQGAQGIQGERGAPGAERSPSDSDPQDVSTSASAGTSPLYSRSDHVHDSDLLTNAQATDADSDVAGRITGALLEDAITAHAVAIPDAIISRTAIAPSSVSTYTDASNHFTAGEMELGTLDDGEFTLAQISGTTSDTARFIAIFSNTLLRGGIIIDSPSGFAGSGLDVDWRRTPATLFNGQPNQENGFVWISMEPVPIDDFSGKSVVLLR